MEIIRLHTLLFQLKLSEEATIKSSIENPIKFFLLYYGQESQANLPEYMCFKTYTYSYF